MLVAQFLVCPAPEALPIAKVTLLRNFHPMEQGFHKLRYILFPLSQTLCSKNVIFYANLETSERARCMDLWHRGLPRIPWNSPSLAWGRRHYLVPCSDATPRQLTFVGHLLLKGPSPTPCPPDLALKRFSWYRKWWLSCFSQWQVNNGNKNIQKQDF